MSQLRTKLCEQCGEVMHIYVSDVRRGKGMFCSKSCAAKCQNVPKVWRMCAVCGGRFKTMEGDVCCEECADLSVRNT